MISFMECVKHLNLVPIKNPRTPLNWSIKVQDSQQVSMEKLQQRHAGLKRILQANHLSQLSPNQTIIFMAMSVAANADQNLIAWRYYLEIIKNGQVFEGDDDITPLTLTEKQEQRWLKKYAKKEVPPETEER